MRQSNRPKFIPSAASLMKGALFLISSGSLLIGGLLIFSLWRSGDQFWRKLTSWATEPQPAPQVDVKSIVVKQIQDASELTTAIFSMEAVVPTQQDATIGGVVIGTTKLLYIASGEVRAGVDLSKIGPQDIQVKGETLTLRLPPPRILDSKVDVAKSSVYDYNRGALGLGPDVAPQLQTLAQQRALEKIRSAACEKGILEKASDRAKLVVEQLIHVPAYKNVVVTTQPPDQQTCQAPPAIAPSPSSSPPAPTPSPTLPAAPRKP